MGSAQMRGLVIGLTLGVVWMWLGFGAALVAAAMGLVGWLIGWLVGMVASTGSVGNVRLADLWEDLQGRRNA